MLYNAVSALQAGITDLGFSRVDNPSSPNSDTIVFTRPSTVNQVGDLMVVVIAIQSSASARTYTAPTGWIAARNAAIGFVVFYKYAVTADLTTSTYSFVNSTTADTIVGIMLCQRNAVPIVGAKSSYTTTVSVPAITLNYSDSTVFAFFRSSSASTTYTTPTGFTVYSADPQSATAPTFAVYNDIPVPSGSTGTVATTASTSTDGILIGFSPKSSYPNQATFIGYNYVANPNSTVDAVTVNVPTGTQNNDIMLAFTSSGSTAFNTPTGWTAIYNVSNNAGLTAWYRIANSEPTSYTFTCSSSVTANTAATIVTFRGGTYDTSGAVSTTDPNTANVTPTATSSIVVGWVTLRNTATFTNNTQGIVSTVFTDYDAGAPSSLLMYITDIYTLALTSLNVTTTTSTNQAGIAVSIKPA